MSCHGRDSELRNVSAASQAIRAARTLTDVRKKRRDCVMSACPARAGNPQQKEGAAHAAATDEITAPAGPAALLGPGPGAEAMTAAPQGHGAGNRPAAGPTGRARAGWPW